MKRKDEYRMLGIISIINGDTINGTMLLKEEAKILLPLLAMIKISKFAIGIFKTKSSSKKGS